MADADPRVREHAIRLAESRLDRAPSLADRLIELASDPEPRIRFQTAFSLGFLEDDRSVDTLATIARTDAADPSIRTAVLSAVPRRAGALLAVLVAGFTARTDGAAEEDEIAHLLGELAAVVGAANQQDDVNTVLATVGDSKLAEHPALRLATVRGLGDGLTRSGLSLRELFKEETDETRAAVSALGEVFAQAGRIARDTELPQARRVEGILLLGNASFEAAAPLLQDLLTFREPQAIQLAAARALSAIPRPEVARILIERWRSYSPPIRREVVEALFSRVDRLPILLTALEQERLQPGDLDPARVRSLLAHSGESIRQRAEKMFDGRRITDRRKVLEQYMPALELEGDADRGQKVFERQCATCHRVGDRGHDVGPGLATVQSRTAESLLTQILDPNREVAPEYLNYTLVAIDGRIITGIIVEETATSVTLRRAEGVQDIVLRSNIERLVSTGLSAMPEGLEKEIDTRQMADLIRFVRRIGQRTE